MRWLCVLIVLAACAGCLTVDKSITVYNLAPCTWTTIDAQYASETDASGNTAQPSLTLPLMP